MSLLEAQDIANNGIVLESGRVRLTGLHAEILNNPKISHLYLGGTLSHNEKGNTGVVLKGEHG